MCHPSLEQQCNERNGAQECLQGIIVTFSNWNSLLNLILETVEHLQNVCVVLFIFSPSEWGQFENFYLSDL